MTHPNQTPSPSDIRQEDVRELLPCPFCGPGQSMVDPWYDDVSKRWTVGCGRCGSSSGRSVHAEGSKEAAIKSWNTRAALSAQTGEPVAYVNGDELDNLLDDRTAIITGKRGGWHKTPLYASPPPQPDTSPSPLSSGEVRKWLQKIVDLVDAEDATEPLDDAINYANKALAVLSQPPATEQIRREVIEAAQVVFETFKRDEAQGYRSRDRQFAIDILGRALAATEQARSHEDTGQEIKP